MTIFSWSGLASDGLVKVADTGYEFETKQYKGGTDLVAPPRANKRRVRTGKDDPRTGEKNTIPTTAKNPSRNYRVPRDKVRADCTTDVLRGDATDEIRVALIERIQEEMADEYKES